MHASITVRPWDDLIYRSTAAPEPRRTGFVTHAIPEVGSDPRRFETLVRIEEYLDPRGA